MSGSNSSYRGDAAGLEPLSFTVHSMPRPQAEEARRSRGRLKMLFLLLMCAAPVIASYLTYFVIRPEGRSNYSALVDPARPMPAGLRLTDLQGRPVDAASLQGQWLLVVVGDAACDAACERRLYLQRQLREMTGRERERIDKLWLVLDDASPAPALQAALEAAPATRVLRAPRADVAAWLRPAEGQALESHLYVVDPMGQWMMRAPAEPEPRKLLRDVERLLRASASWDRAGR